MNLRPYLKGTLFLFFFSLLSFGAYKWEQSRQLESYFIQQFALDWKIQVDRNQQDHHGDIFEKAYLEMKELGYNPYQIEQIIIKGFDQGQKLVAESKALKNQTQNIS